MKSFGQLKGKLKLVLISAILILCTSFIFVSCGKGPQLKVDDPSKGAYAIDFTLCPSAICRILLGSSQFHSNPNKTIAGKELTVEAWVKSKAASAAAYTGGITGRFDTAGIAIYMKAGVPKAVIRRVGASGAATATADYIASSNMTAIADTLWHHVAGVLTADDHSATHADCTNKTDDFDCTGTTPTGDPIITCNTGIHLDIYVDGVYRDCNTTYGEDNDTAVTAPALTEEAGDEFLGVGTFGEALTEDVDGVTLADVFPGIIDEVRLWGTDRSVADIVACKGKELTLDSGTCGRMTSDLIAYLRFNKGTSDSAIDWAETGGAGTMEYFGTKWSHWTTGWTTDTPGLIADQS